MQSINTVSLFTGCGGLDLGFQNAGFNVEFMADILPEAIETLKYNHKKGFIFGPPLNSGDIVDLTGDFILKKSGFSKIDMIIGGPPCQPFSIAAAQRFLKDDKRFKRTGFEQEKGQLIFEYLRLIKELDPKAFLIENVPGLIKIDNGKTVNDLKEVLETLGYHVKVKILEASNFGVPQFRSRAFIIGNKVNSDFQFPENIFSDNKVGCAQALAFIDQSTLNNETRIHKEESIERYRKLLFGEREKKGRVDRLNPNLPSKTVIAGGSSGGGRSHLHPYSVRTMSVRECARLQTFPDNFIFKGKISRQFTQVGNAVPVLLAEHIARSIGKQIFKLSYPIKLKAKGSYGSQDKSKKDLMSHATSNSEYEVYDDLKKAANNVYSA